MIRTVALTGTPGVGKTTLAAEAAKHDVHVVDVKEWAHACGAVVGHDPDDGADVVDVDILRKSFARRTAEAPGRILFEGHLSHELPVDAVWVVRLDPEVLRPRLEARGYPPHKVLENLEAEALDILLFEALDSGATVVQRDGTRRTPEQLWQSFAEATFEHLKRNDLEEVDWSHRLPL